MSKPNAMTTIGFCKRLETPAPNQAVAIPAILNAIAIPNTYVPAVIMVFLRVLFPVGAPNRMLERIGSMGSMQGVKASPSPNKKNMPSNTGVEVLSKILLRAFKSSLASHHDDVFALCDEFSIDATDSTLVSYCMI